MHILLLMLRFISTPIGRIFKLKETQPKKPIENKILEEEFRKSFKKSIPNKNLLIV